MAVSALGADVVQAESGLRPFCGRRPLLAVATQARLNHEEPRCRSTPVVYSYPRRLFSMRAENSNPARSSADFVSGARHRSRDRDPQAETTTGDRDARTGHPDASPPRRTLALSGNRGPPHTQPRQCRRRHSSSAHTPGSRGAAAWWSRHSTRSCSRTSWRAPSPTPCAA